MIDTECGANPDRKDDAVMRRSKHIESQIFIGPGSENIRHHD